MKIPAFARAALYAPTALLLLAFATPAQDIEPLPLYEKSSELFTLRYHGGDEKLATDALEAIDEVWPIVARAFGVTDARPSKPLVVNLYRSLEGYRHADQQLTGGKFQRNTAMSHWGSRTAHVALQPPCTDETLRAIGLPAQTIALLAWEAAHVARFELCANFEQHPQWLCDGLAASTAQAVFEKRFPGSAHSAPFWSMDIWRVQQLLEGKKLPPLASLLGDAVDELGLSSRYAARAVAYSFFAADAQRAKLSKLLSTVRSTGGGSKFPAAIQKLAKNAFGSQDKAFARYVASLEPQWEETFRSLTTSGKEWQQIAFPDTNAVAWRTEPIEAKSFRAKGALRILPGGRGQLNFLFARTDGGFYSIAFVADQGFTVFDYRSATNEWNRVGDGNAPALRLGVRTNFAVEAKHRELTVKVDELSWSFELPRELPASIAWGLGAQAGPENSKTGSAGLWIDVAVTK